MSYFRNFCLPQSYEDIGLCLLIKTCLTFNIYIYNPSENAYVYSMS